MAWYCQNFLYKSLTQSTADPATCAITRALSSKGMFGIVHTKHHEPHHHLPSSGGKCMFKITVLAQYFCPSILYARLVVVALVGGGRGVITDSNSPPPPNKTPTNLLFIIFKRCLWVIYAWLKMVFSKFHRFASI